MVQKKLSYFFFPPCLLAKSQKIVVIYFNSYAESQQSRTGQPTNELASGRGCCPRFIGIGNILSGHGVRTYLSTYYCMKPAITSYLNYYKSRNAHRRSASVDASNQT